MKLLSFWTLSRSFHVHFDIDDNHKSLMQIFTFINFETREYIRDLKNMQSLMTCGPTCVIFLLNWKYFDKNKLSCQYC